jgi:hypothetical protein
MSDELNSKSPRTADLGNGKIGVHVEDAYEWSALKEALRAPLTPQDLQSAEADTGQSIDFSSIVSQHGALQGPYQIHFSTSCVARRFEQLLDNCNETKRLRIFAELAAWEESLQRDPFFYSIPHPEVEEVQVTYGEPISIRYVVDEPNKRITIIGIYDIAPKEIVWLKPSSSTNAGPPPSSSPSTGPTSATPSAAP